MAVLTSRSRHEKNRLRVRIERGRSDAYVYGPGSTPIAQFNLTSGTETYLVADALGSVRGIVSATGSLTASTSYDAWGNPETTGGLTSYSPIGFAGGYTDPTGLVYLIDRYYDPSTGQFLSVDPMVATTGQAYAYTGDNPVNQTDPNGELSCAVLACGTASAPFGLPYRIDYALNFFVSKGLTEDQAAGIVGNLTYESGGNLDGAQVQFGCQLPGCGVGIAQWTDPGPRWSALVSFAKSESSSTNNFYVQVQFVWLELTTTYEKTVLQPLKAATSVSAATYIVDYRYESPAQPGGTFGQRLQDANKALGLQNGSVRLDSADSSPCGTPSALS